MQVPVSRSRGAVFHSGSLPGGNSTEPPIVHQRMNRPADIAAFVARAADDEEQRQLHHIAGTYSASPAGSNVDSVQQQQRVQAPPDPTPDPTATTTTKRRRASVAAAAAAAPKRSSESESSCSSTADESEAKKPRQRMSAIESAASAESLMKSGTDIFSPFDATPTSASTVRNNINDVSSISRPRTAGGDVVTSPRQQQQQQQSLAINALDPASVARKSSVVTFSEATTPVDKGDQQRRQQLQLYQQQQQRGSPISEQQQTPVSSPAPAAVSAASSSAFGHDSSSSMVTISRSELHHLLQERDALHHEVAALNHRLGEVHGSFEQCRHELQQARGYITLMKQKIAAAVAPETLCRTQEQIWNQRHGIDDTDVKLRAIHDELGYVKRQNAAFASGKATSSDPYVSMRAKHDAEVRKLTEAANRDAQITAAMRDDMQKVVHLYFYGMKQLAISVEAAAEGEHYPPPLSRELQQLLSNPETMALAEAAAQPGFFEQHLPRHKLSTKHNILQSPVPLGCGPKSITAFIQDVKETIRRCFTVVSDNVIAVGHEATAMRGVLQDAAADVINEVRTMMVPTSLFNTDFLSSVQNTAERALMEVETVLFPEGTQDLLPQATSSRRNSVTSSRQSSFSPNRSSHPHRHQQHHAQQRHANPNGGGGALSSIFANIGSGSGNTGGVSPRRPSQTGSAFGGGFGTSGHIFTTHSHRSGMSSSNDTPLVGALNLDVSANTPTFRGASAEPPPHYPPLASAPFPGTTPSGFVQTPASGVNAAAAAAAAAVSSAEQQQQQQQLMLAQQQQLQQLQQQLQEKEKEKEERRRKLLKEAQQRVLMHGNPESLMHVTSAMSNMCCLLGNNLKAAEENRMLTENILTKFYDQIKSMIRVPKRMESVSSSSASENASETGTAMG